MVGRSAHQAVRKVEKDVREGYGYAVDLDLEKFFDTVDHDILMNRAARRVRDKGLLRLIGEIPARWGGGKGKVNPYGQRGPARRPTITAFE